MNRLEEYNALLQEIENPVRGLEGTLERAKKRKKRKMLVLRPVLGVAAACLVFVLLVNVSTPIAYACSQVPFLKALAEAVTFSPSLSAAVENEYVQQLDLAQTDGDVSVKVEYLIVDQKQVNIFFRLFSDSYEQMSVTPRFFAKDGGKLKPSSTSSDGTKPSGELHKICVDFLENDVPDGMLMKLNVEGWNPYGAGVEPPTANVEEDMFHISETYEENFVAQFEFVLEFDPKFTAAGKEFAVNQTVELEGQKFTITDVEIYPTHMRVNVMDDPENTAWLKSLYFYIETDYGMKFEPVSNGISATGVGDSKSLGSFRAESAYFYEADSMKIVITGAEWLKKDMEKIYINLETGETGRLPEGVVFDSAKERDDGWILSLKATERKENHHHQIVTAEYYDPEGIMYEIRAWSSTMVDETGANGERYFTEEVALNGYHGTEVWLTPAYSHVWTAQNPLVVVIQ